ncbi:MAG: hypothetical protein P1P63_04040 [Treponemataceae bacterium]
MSALINSIENCGHLSTLFNGVKPLISVSYGAAPSVKIPFIVFEK